LTTAENFQSSSKSPSWGFPGPRDHWEMRRDKENTVVVKKLHSGAQSGQKTQKTLPAGFEPAVSA
jgi:hypothetical protein